MSTFVKDLLGKNLEAGRWLKVNGIELYLESYGEGEPLVLLHGNGGDLTTWSAQIGEFAAHYRVLAVDSRAHGRSTGAPESLSYRRMAADIDALLGALDVPKARILGWSDGGIIGLLLALDFPARVSALAISGANIQSNEEALSRADIDAVEQAASGIGVGWRDQQLARLMAEEPNLPYSALAGVACPTLVMAGDRDIIRIEHTVKIFQALPNAELAIFPHADHGFFLSQPEPFASIVLDFFWRSGVALSPS